MLWCVVCCGAGAGDGGAGFTLWAGDSLWACHSWCPNEGVRVAAQDVAGGGSGHDVGSDSGADPEDDKELKCGHGVFSIVVGCGGAGRWHAATASSVGLVPPS